jgi:uroporphyrinogen-III synthase
VVFTSAPGAAAWLAEVDAQGLRDSIVARSRSGAMVAAAVGPVTAKPLLESGIEPIVPDRGRLGALVRALVSHYEQAQTTALSTTAGRLQVRRTVALLDDHVLPLSPSGLEVLRVLVDAGGDVVSREDLLRVLPGDSADPHTAEVAVARLRDAVAVKGLIQTVVKRGYRVASAERG